MHPLRHVSQGDVWAHWEHIENHSSQNFRSDIRGPLPTDLIWFLCEVQPHDIEQIFVISSSDWSDISGGTFRVSVVASKLDSHSDREDTVRIVGDIRKKNTFIDSGGQLDSRLILVTNNSSFKGPYTLIEGNRRSVVFLRRNTLVGSLVYVGFSPKVVDYYWARFTYENLIQTRRVLNSSL